GSCSGVSCTYTPIREGLSCTPDVTNNPCTSVSSGTCRLGSCVGEAINEGGYCAPTRDTGPSRDCRSQTHGICYSGQCQPNSLPDGTTCYPQEGDLCDFGTCNGGFCTNPQARTCGVPEGCGPSGTCDRATGLCGNYPGPFEGYGQIA